MAGEAPARRRWSAVLVAAGILLSRIAGLIRERIIAHYFGISLWADVFRVALRMPNVLQNLLGEGTLSASFIPVYSELLEQKRYREAGRVAGAVFALLLAVVGGLVLAGVSLAPLLVSIFAVGFKGEQRELTIACTRIIFPMTGTLVLAAWALGILNSHRKFFIPYVAPVLWNGAIIATALVLGGRLDLDDLVVALAWGALLGGLAQLAIQLPWVLRLERNLQVRWDLRLAGVRETVRNAVPVVLGRGVVQVGGYFDIFLGSLLTTGAVAALSYAQVLYMLPVSLFGMSQAVAELPELSRQRGAEAEILRRRINGGLRRIAFLVVPSAIGYLLIGDLLAAALYQTGEFGADDTRLVHLVLAAYALGLLASTSTRLLSSAFYALHDTRTPALVALMRVLLAAGLGCLLMFPLDRIHLGGKALGPVGLALAVGVAAWLEWFLLSRTLAKRIGSADVGSGVIARMVLAALLGSASARAAALLTTGWHPIAVAAVALLVLGIVYFSITHLLGLGEVREMAQRIASRLGRRSP